MDAALAVGISITVIMLSALVFERFKLPLILGMLLAGILVGPFSPLAEVNILGFDFGKIIITDPSIIGVFAFIGAALILFGIGLEFSAVKLTQIGLFTFLAAAIKIGIVTLVAYITLVAFGFSTTTSLLMGVALSFSSTPIIIKLLEASGKIRRPEVPFIISIVIIEDLVIVFLLGLMTNHSVGMDEYAFAISLLRVVLTFIFAYLVLSRLINRFLSLISHSDELLILGTVSLVLVIGYMSESIGLSFSIGAFLAGSTIAGSFESRKIEEKIKPFNSLFASFFFFSIGLLVNMGGVVAEPFLLLFIIAFILPLNFCVSGFATYLAGLNGRNACFCAATFLSLSELSLLLISQGTANGALPPGFLGSFAFAIIASSFLSAWLINRENESYNVIQAIVPQFFIKNMRLFRSTALGMRRAFRESSRYYNVVERLPSISHATESMSTREHLALTSKNSALLAIVSIATYLGVFFASQPGWEVLDSLFVFILASFVVSSALFLVEAKSTLSSVIKMVQRSSSGAKYAPLGHFFASLIFLALCAIYFLAYALAPSSLSIILVLPAFAFFLRSILSAFRAVTLGSGRL